MPGSSSTTSIRVIAALDSMLKCSVRRRCRFLARTVKHGKQDGKLAAFAGRARDPDLPAVLPDDVTDHGETHAGASYVRGDRRTSSPELLKNRPLLGCRDADALVS